MKQIQFQNSLFDFRPPGIGRCPHCGVRVNVLHYEWFEDHYENATKDVRKRFAELLHSYRVENPLEEC